jgi:TolB-like protein
VPFLFEDCTVDTDRREIRRGTAIVSPGPQVFDLLVYLIRNRDRVVSKDDLLEAVWRGRIVSEQTLTSHINAARKAIGDSGDEQRLIRTVPRKGFRFVGEVREARATTASAVAAPPPATPVATEALALPDRPSIAVLPFANLSGAPQQDYLSDGITEDIITELSRFSELLVIARNSSFQYKGKAVDIRQVGRELGARYVLEGSVRWSGDRIRIAAQLIYAATGAHRWAERYDRELHDQVSGPGAADRHLLHADIEPCRCAARHGIPVQPEPTQRRHIASVPLGPSGRNGRRPMTQSITG